MWLYYMENLNLLKFIQITYTIFYNYSCLRASILGYKSSKIWFLPYMLLIWLWYNRISSQTWIFNPSSAAYQICIFSIVGIIPILQNCFHSTICERCLTPYPTHIVVVHKMFCVAFFFFFCYKKSLRLRWQYIHAPIDKVNDKYILKMINIEV